MLWTFTLGWLFIANLLFLAKDDLTIAHTRRPTRAANPDHFRLLFYIVIDDSIIGFYLSLGVFLAVMDVDVAGWVVF
jgi:hypothetical protein